MKQTDYSPVKWAARASLLATFLLCSCQSLLPTDVSDTPADLHRGEWQFCVKTQMGPPQRTEDWVDEGGGRVVGEIWHYNDEWHTNPGWFGWKDNFCSWDLYFDSDKKLAGWKLVEPLSSQGRAREHFWTDEMWKKKARDLLSGFLDDNDVKGAEEGLTSVKPCCVECKCARLEMELQLYPANVRYGHDVKDLLASLRVVASHRSPDQADHAAGLKGDMTPVMRKARKLKDEL